MTSATDKARTIGWMVGNTKEAGGMETITDGAYTAGLMVVVMRLV